MIFDARSLHASQFWNVIQGTLVKNNQIIQLLSQYQAAVSTYIYCNWAVNCEVTAHSILFVHGA